MDSLANIISRLEQVMSHYDLSASAFAEAIGVQRSSISHLLSGRNKPSLEFMLKVVSNFPEISLHWLFLGIGEFLVDTQETNPKPATLEEPLSQPSPTKTENRKEPVSNEIERIVIFFKNGSFKSYYPENCSF